MRESEHAMVTYWDTPSTVVWLWRICQMSLPDEPFKQKLVPIDAQAIQHPMSKCHCDVPQFA